jgi:hypothetical protein
MAHFHEGSLESYLTHECKRCKQSTGHALHIDVTQPHLCNSCKLIEKRDVKLNSLLKEDKKWWQIWKK